MQGTVLSAPWMCWEGGWMASNDIHVYPVNDLREHITDGPGCPCEPRVKVDDEQP